MSAPRTPGGLSAHEVLILVPAARIDWCRIHRERCAGGLSFDAASAAANAHVVAAYGHQADNRIAAAIAALPPTERA